MKINKDFIHREIAGEHILVPIGKEIRGNSGMLVLSEVGSRIFELLPNVEDEQEIMNILIDEYEVDKQILCNDVHAFLERLKELQILQEKGQ